MEELREASSSLLMRAGTLPVEAGSPPSPLWPSGVQVPPQGTEGPLEGLEGHPPCVFSGFADLQAPPGSPVGTAVQPPNPPDKRNRGKSAYSSKWRKTPKKGAFWSLKTFLF